MSEIGVAVWSAEGLLPVSTWQRERLSLLLAQSCLTLCDPMDCSPPTSSVHRILQARILEWGSCSLLQGIFLTQESNPNLLHLLYWQVDSLPLRHLRSQYYTAQNGETLSRERIQCEKDEN